MTDLTEYWSAGVMYALAAALAVAAVLLWGVGVRNLLASRRDDDYGPHRRAAA